MEKSVTHKSITVGSPGRINIIGEHTDYNNGFVLPAAIDKKTIFKIEENGTSNTVNITATYSNEQFAFDLTDFSPLKNGWQNYVMGVVHELLKLGARIKGFDASFEGHVPIGSGMSSSAALECSLAYGLNELFHLNLNKWQIIKACQMAEHNFVGIKCGIMDQFASMMGKKNQVMLLDCRSLEFQYLPLRLNNYQLLLLDTNVSHALASSEYNTRRSECEEGVFALQQMNPFSSIHSLRDVSFKMLMEAKMELPENVFRRCKHIVTENNRVIEATRALSQKNLIQLGKLIYQSHFSLQNDYEVSCPELDYLVQQTLDKDYILGSRMMGGGFGGCTINIIEKEKVDAFISLTAKNYEDRYGLALKPYSITIENGTEVL